MLGALAITSEYSTGMIRTSLSVQPRRGTVLAAKGIVFTLVSLVTGLVASFGSFFIGQAILSSKNLNTSLGDPNVLRAVIGGGLFLAVCGMLAFGLGTLLRHTAARHHRLHRAAVRAVRAGQLPALELAGARGQVDPVQRGQPGLGHGQPAGHPLVLRLDRASPCSSATR